MRYGDRLADYDRDPVLVRDLLAHMGVDPPFVPGKPFRSPVSSGGSAPGDPTGQTVPTSGTVYRNKHGIFKYRQNNPSGEIRRYTLAQLYAAYTSGRPIEDFGSLQSVSMATWKIRMLLQLARIPHPHIELPALPSSAPPHARDAYDGSVLLLECRYAYSGRLSPAPYTYRWAERWVPMPFDRARRGIIWLKEHGYLVAAGKECGTTLYLPPLPQT